jgi:hypothetical protein
VVACRRSCFCVALSARVEEIAGIAVLGLPVRIKDPLPDQRSTLVGWLPRRGARVDRRHLALGTAVVPRTALLAYAGCRAFGLLHGHLLDECLHLTMQVTRLGCRGRGHGSEQRRCYDELLARARWRIRVVDVEFCVDTLAGLVAELAHVFAAR